MNKDGRLDRIQALNLAFAAREEQLMDELAQGKRREEQISGQMLLLREQAWEEIGRITREFAEQRETGAKLLSMQEQAARAIARLAQEGAERDRALIEQLRALRDESSRLEQMFGQMLEKRGASIFRKILSLFRKTRVIPASPEVPARLCVSESAAGASALGHLLALEDQAFVECAYRTLLRRDPDPGGMSLYLARLRAGTGKAQILADLVLSPEGKKWGAFIPGLDELIKPYRKKRSPLIGRIFGLSGCANEEREMSRRIQPMETSTSDGCNGRFSENGCAEGAANGNGERATGWEADDSARMDELISCGAVRRVSDLINR